MRAAAARKMWVAAAILLMVVASGVSTSIVKDRQQQSEVAVALTGGDPRMAPQLFRRYGCTGCHTIPGIPGADGKVAGQLVDMRQRVYVGGVLTNTPENLVQWIVSPPRFSPKTAMPATGITPKEARDLAAYLYAQ